MVQINALVIATVTVLVTTVLSNPVDTNRPNAISNPSQNSISSGTRSRTGTYKSKPRKNRNFNRVPKPGSRQRGTRMKKFGKLEGAKAKYRAKVNSINTVERLGLVDGAQRASLDKKKNEFNQDINAINSVENALESGPRRRDVYSIDQREFDEEELEERGYQLDLMD